MEEFVQSYRWLKIASVWSPQKAQRRAQRRRERRAKFWELLGGRCAECGSRYQLEFDHLDPAHKSLTISKKIDRSDLNLMEEVKKCQLLCKKCHHQKTIKNRQYHPKVERDISISM